jgi:hypothetical protein
VVTGTVAFEITVRNPARKLISCTATSPDPGVAITNKQLTAGACRHRRCALKVESMTLLREVDGTDNAEEPGADSGRSEQAQPISAATCAANARFRSA